MKRLLIALAAAGAVGLAGFGFASEGKCEKKGKRQRPTAEAIFQKMDKNGDGNVTLEEFKAFREAMHAKWKELREKRKAEKKPA